MVGSGDAFGVSDRRMGSRGDAFASPDRRMGSRGDVFASPDHRMGSLGDVFASPDHRMGSRGDAIASPWERFCGRLRIYGKALESLNGPCSSDEMQAAEARLGIALPGPLRHLLTLNNGQRAGTVGIFKSLSGWDVYQRHVFLSAEAVAGAYHDFVQDELLATQFGVEEIPFAVAGKADCGSLCSVQAQTGAVSLIDTEVHDWTLPDEWQLVRRRWAPTLSLFLDDQTAQYR
jgi:hypothetical protein